jgi:3-hydroxyisobutyrate dehydrogenase-like beta-hydroxyacid dehydrogenase
MTDRNSVAVDGPRIGFAGLGQMGRHMAANLVKAGHPVTVTSRRPVAFADLEALGAEATTDATRLADADLLFLALPDAASVRDFLFGANGIADRLGHGQTVIDLGTTDYSDTLDIAGRLAAGGCRFLDAPVSGMEARARDGTLTVMCGGDVETLDSVRPCFAAIGSKILHMGPVGSGQMAKLINQLLFDINAAALAEILPMAVKLGLKAESVAEIVNSGTGRSYASEFFVPNILQGRFEAGYPLKAAYKDLVSGARISADLGIPLPVLAAATATYQQALLKGHGQQDKGAMIRVFEDLLAVQFRGEGHKND